MCLGVIHHEIIPQDRTINADLYCEILSRVEEAMKEKRPERKAKDVLFLQDNARPHTAKLTKAKLKAIGWEVLEHPPYSPDLAPSDFHLFLSLKGNIRGKKFDNREAVETWLEQFYASKPTTLFERGINKLEGRWAGVIEFEGSYAVE